jgi:hypothetical protein
MYDFDYHIGANFQFQTIATEWHLPQLPGALQAGSLMPESLW